MGAKTPCKLKLRRPTYKCNQCSRNFLSTQALKSHQYCVHKIKGNGRPVREKSKLTNLPEKSVKNTDVMLKKVPQTVEANVENSVTLNNEDNRKIEFECPQCLKMFSVYFSAFKHIQRVHCINEKGQRVASSSSDIIKPVRVELCTKCNIRVRTNERHRCSDANVDSNVLGIKAICTGCKQQFASIQLFDLHVTGLHCDKIEGMFFPTNIEFLQWKNNMENETSNRYLILNKCSAKQTYRCSFYLATDKNEKDEVSHFCPSSIIVREFSKGVQVHFYKQHYGHPCPEYNIPKQFSKYTITSLMEAKTKAQLDVVDMSDDTDLYVQFKTLMDNIVLDAAKVKINHLKVLIGKALEMSTILKQYIGDEDYDEYPKTAPLNKTMTDDQITTALETFTKDIKKRKSTTVAVTPNANPTVALKRQKITTPNTDLTDTKKDVISIAIPPIKTYSNRSKQKTPIILNTFSLADEVVNEEDSKELLKEIDLPKINPKISSPASLSLSSFNDSYREFVDKNFTAKADSKSNSKKEAQTNANQNTKEKIKVLSKNDINERVELRLPVDINKNNNVNIKSIQKIEKNNSITNNDTINKTKELNNSRPINKTRELNNSRTINKTKEPNNRSSIDKQKANNIKKYPTVKKGRVDKKKVMKTKIGQFKPSLSPKKTESTKGNRDLNKRNSKSKLEFDYEVKEQENDCNILILKI
ncbi:unnamed protein product [Diatraea saccharalis]|uniref:C2H2-type domain-containing protein n=1 Tax=Diatraea saccharalis TaxID=40085 RepID=A0A9N9R6P5_9NEOP|nr:unnamed protein product [Diatraea saccharalis]